MKTTNFRFLAVIFRHLFFLLILVGGISNSQAQSEYKDIKTLSSVADSFVKSLAGGNYEQARKTLKGEKMAKELEDADFEGYWRALTEQLGRYQRHELNSLDLNNTKIVSVICRFERGQHEIQFVYYAPSDFFYFEAATVQNLTGGRFLYTAAQKARQIISQLVVPNNDSEITKYFVDAKMAQNSFAEYRVLRRTLGSPVALPSVYAESEPSFRYSGICGAPADVESICVTLKFENAELIVETRMSKDYRIASLKFDKRSTNQHAAWRPPDYAKSDDVVEESVSFGQSEWKLNGVFTRPKAPPPPAAGYPAVVIFQGGPGPADADGTVGNSKMIKDLAWGLAARGISSFRYEKRAYPHFEKFYRRGSYTFADDTLDDAREAVETVKQIRSVDPANLFVLGHSLGGIAASTILSADDKIRGGILMATSSINFVDNALAQAVFLSTVWRKYYKESGRSARLPFLTGYDKAFLQDAKQTVDDIKNDRLPRGRLAEDTYGGHPFSFWADINKYDSIRSLKKNDSPVLILSADFDERVVSFENQPAWKLFTKTRRNITLKEYAGLDHSMSEPVFNFYDKHLSEKVISDASDWIKSLIVFTNR